jgi:cupin superfamily acireductone dioxygenase involved in methionine salvage
MLGCSALRFLFDEEYHFSEVQSVGVYGVVLKKGDVVIVPNSLAHYLKEKPYFELVDVEIKEPKEKKRKGEQTLIEEDVLEEDNEETRL